MQDVAYSGLRCSLDDCERPHYGLGLCTLHYQRQRQGRPLHAPIRAERMNPSGLCAAQGCDRPQRAQGYCMAHYQRRRMGIEPFDGPIRSQSKHGEGHVSHGYRLIPVNGKAKREHRAVMEARLGRELFPDETVHHLNGNRLDNRLENLELWSTWHPKGQRVKDKIAWAREVLARYSQGDQLALFD